MSDAGSASGSGTGARTTRIWWATAGGITLVLSLLDFILCLLCMLCHVCAIETDGQNDPDDYNFFHYFYIDYLAGDDCEYSNSDLVKPTPAWPDCTAREGATVTSKGHGYTDPEATFIWITVYMVIAVIWMLTAVPLLLGVFTPKLMRQASALSYAWVGWTCLVLLYGMTAAIVYLVDLSIPLAYKDCEEHRLYNEDFQTKTVEAVLVLPMFFARGFLVWFGLLGFLAVFVWATIVRGPREEERQVLFGDRKPADRSLSAYDNIPIGVQEGEDDIQVKADSTPEPAATPEPAPAPQQAPVVAQAAVVTAAAVSAAQDRHGGHANDSFDDDEGIFDRRRHESDRDRAISAYAAANAAAARRSHKYPAPLAPSQLHIANQPPIIVPHPGSAHAAASADRWRPQSPGAGPGAGAGSPKQEFAIPRARPDRDISAERGRSGHHGGRSQSRPVRTPSGREVTATEYLRAGEGAGGAGGGGGGRRRSYRDDGDDRYY